MANPPFNLDVTDPADNAIVSQFPSNERAFRDNTNSWLGVEHDINTGYHKFQLLSTTAKNALTTPPAGMFVYDTTLGVAQVNTGTDTAPVWSTLGPATGDMKIWPVATAPTGWLNCDGSAVSRTTYAALFALIGTTFGAGDGSTTFNLPNVQRKVLVGQGGTGTSTLGNAIGNTGGEETHTLNTTELPHQTYNVNDPGHTHPAPPGGQFVIFGVNSTGVAGSNNLDIAPATGSATTGISVTDNNGNGAHNNIQPSLVINIVIKT